MYRRWFLLSAVFLCHLVNDGNRRIYAVLGIEIYKSIENARLLASFVKVMNVLNVVLSYTRNPDLQYFTRRIF